MGLFQKPNPQAFQSIFDKRLEQHGAFHIMPLQVQHTIHFAHFPLTKKGSKISGSHFIRRSAMTLSSWFPYMTAPGILAVLT